ncbi:DUF5992 family protein [Photobacterium chitinilyticum]|uniref:DUF5992 family protein n=1 Tax=Photobacterium chitinilyticum TaxID=2485123 RepID=UPI003D0AA0A8
MKKAIKKSTFIVIALFILSPLSISNVNAAARFIAAGTTLKAVGSVFGKEDSFIVITTSDSGPCFNKNILFKRSSVLNDAIHARNYSAALTAFASNAKINIWSNDGTCEGANHILLAK